MGIHMVVHLWRRVNMSNRWSLWLIGKVFGELHWTSYIGYLLKKYVVMFPPHLPCSTAFWVAQSTTWAWSWRPFLSWSQPPASVSSTSTTILPITVKDAPFLRPTTDLNFALFRWLPLWRFQPLLPLLLSAGQNQVQNVKPNSQISP